MNPESPRFGREAYEKVDGNVKEVESSQFEKTERAAELRQELKEALDRGVPPAEIIVLAQEMKSLEDGILSDQTNLEKAEAKHKTFYGDMQAHAMTENSLRDELVAATKEGDYAQVAEIAEKLEQHDQPEGAEAEKFDEYFKTLGIPASLDSAIEGGIISIEISPELTEALKTWETAQVAFKAADGGSSSWIYSDLNDYPWQPLTTTSLETVIVNHGQTTSAERDTLVDAMDKAGYRPLTLAELMALAITKPDLNKRAEYFNSYEKIPLDGVVQSPYFDWDGSRRDLGANGVSRDWPERGRFLFVGK